MLNNIVIAVVTTSRWRGGLARTLLKMGVIGLIAIFEKLFSHNYDRSCCTGVAFTLAQEMTKCHPLYSVHRFQLPQNNLMPIFDTLVLRAV